MSEDLKNGIQAAYFNSTRRGKWICTYTADNTGDYEQRDYYIVEETKFGPVTIISGITNPEDGLFIAYLHNNMPALLQELLNPKTEVQKDVRSDN